MKQNVTETMFIDRFKQSEERGNQFSYGALVALYADLVEMEDECGEEIEFDMIALCCEFTEYETATEAACEHFDFPGMDYDENGDETETAEDVEEKALKYLQDNTRVIEFEGGIIIQDF